MKLTITSAIGAILVVAGIIFVAVQLIRKGRDLRDMRGFSTEAGPVKFALNTSFPGLLVIALGVILLIIAAVTGR